MGLSKIAISIAQLQLDAEWFTEETAPWRAAAFTIEAVAKMAAKADVHFAVLVDNANGKDIVGYSWADFKVDPRDMPMDTRAARKLAELHYIYVAASARGGAGGGAALWQAVEEAAVAAGCSYLELTADSKMAAPLIKFYQRCGCSYMFARLRKELSPAPAGLAPLPFPFQSVAQSELESENEFLKTALEEQISTIDL